MDGTGSQVRWDAAATAMLAIGLGVRERDAILIGVHHTVTVRAG